MAESKLVLENYADGGISLTTPVVVRELLMSLSESDRAKVSVRIESERTSGWLWLVYARSVYIWNFKEKEMNCYELPLPSSGLIHSARLCHVWIQSDDAVNKPPFCVYASPEGCVRYWPKINQSSVYIDKTLEFSSQVGHSITPLKGKHSYPSLILSTTTCGLFLLTVPDGHSNRNMSIQCVPLKAPQNLISGIGRRVSSMIFSAGFPSQEALVNAATTTKKGAPSVNLLYLLNAKCQLQCWQMESQANHKWLWVIDLRQAITEQLAYEIWNFLSTELHYHPNMRIWPLDFVVTARRRLAILTAIFDPSLSENVQYAVVYYAERDDGTAAEFVDLVRLPITRSYEPRMEEIGRDPLNLLCPFSYDGFFVHNESFVAMFHEDERNVYSSSLAESDQIFGSGIHGDQVLLFTLENGLQVATIRSEKQTLPVVTALANQRFQLQHQAKSDDELEEMAGDSSRKTQFKAAFYYFLNHKLPECEAVLDSILSRSSDDLDSLVVNLGVDIADDYPASDPRWLKEFSHHIEQEGVTTRRKAKSRRTDGGSLLLIYQLDDKRKTMEFFFSFLKSMRLNDKLRTCKVTGGKKVPTIEVLREVGEKLEACAAFVRKVEGGARADAVGKICQDAMKSILKERKESTGDTLSVRDVFYRKVSSFHELVPVFVEKVLRFLDQPQSQSEDDISDHQELIVRVGDCLLAVLNAAVKYRRGLEHHMHWQAATDADTWLNTVTARTSLAKYCNRIGNYLAESADTPIADNLTRQCRDMADYILAECSLAPDRRMFESELRRQLIMPLITAERFEQALFLAEKYRDFGLLIEICEKLADDQLLDSFKVKFQQDGFLEFLYDYCISKGKPGYIFHSDAVVPTSEMGRQTAFYLDSRRRFDLQWIHNAKMNNFEKASVALLSLANMENESLDKKKTYLSIAKLVAMTSDHPEESGSLKAAEEGLVMVEHQKRLPPVADGHPLSAEELIEAYISDPAADEWSFAKAIDIMTSICARKMPQEDYNRLRAHLWACAILKDDWRTVLANTEDLMATASDTVFCRTVQLLCTLYKDDRQRIGEYLASANELLQSEELEELAGDPKLEFVLRAGEERIRAWVIGDEEKYANQAIRDGDADNSVIID